MCIVGENKSNALNAKNIPGNVCFLNLIKITKYEIQNPAVQNNAAVFELLRICRNIQ
jgi:hypothetical protein